MADLPDAVRTEITTAGQARTRATTLAGWALLYAPLTWWWWPAAPLTVVLALSAWQHIRSATATYAELLEAATRLHSRGLADQLGIACTGPLDPSVGDVQPRGYRAARGQHELSTALGTDGKRRETTGLTRNRS